VSSTAKQSGALLLVWVVLCFTGCREQEQHRVSVADNQVINLLDKIRNSDYVEEVFAADSLSLIIPPDITLGNINYIHISDNGEIFLVDSRFSVSILRFSEEGLFLGQLGKRGQGPGEYQIPKHVITSKHNIFVSDVGLRRISVFDTLGRFVHSFVADGFLDGLYLGENNTLITHQLRGRGDLPTIRIYSEKGGLMSTVGQTSDSYRKFVPLAYIPSAPFLAYSKGSFFQTDYTDYHITVYSSHGALLTRFGVKPEQYRSPLTAPVHLIPRAKYATSDFMERVKNFYNNYLSKCSELGGILVFEPGIICTLILNRSKKTGFKNRLYFNFYTTSGELIKNDVPFKHYPIDPEHPRFLLLSPPDKIIMYEFENESDYSDQIVKLFILEPKPGKASRESGK